jgi:hypothetical protein
MIEHFHPKITNRIQLENIIKNIPIDISTSTTFYQKGVHKIIAIGDLHGDFRKLHDLLIKLQVMNYQNNWIAKNTILVQVGDILDDGGRGLDYDKGVHSADEISIYHLLIDLNTQARQNGGAVFICIGNHELMNIVYNDYNYVNKYTESYYINVLKVNRRLLFSKGSELVKKLSNILKVVVKLGDYYFCHGGIPPYITTNTQFLKIIADTNKSLKNILTNNSQKDDNLKIINDITWDRTYGARNISSNDCERLARVLNGGTLIIGHTIQKGGINSKCNNHVFRVDVGLSDSFGICPKLQALVLE